MVCAKNWWCTSSCKSSEHNDAFGGQLQASLEMDLKVDIAQVWICTWRACLSQLGEIPEDYDQPNFKRELLPLITEIWRPKLNK
jgi:hypothetical protein